MQAPQLPLNQRKEKTRRISSIGDLEREIMFQLIARMIKNTFNSNHQLPLSQRKERMRRTSPTGAVVKETTFQLIAQKTRSTFKPTLKRRRSLLQPLSKSWLISRRREIKNSLSQPLRLETNMIQNPLTSKPMLKLKNEK